MQIQLSDHFTYRKLLRFTLPSVLMMIFTSIYGVVDGFFVSNFVGKTPFAAVNFIMPVLMICGALGTMLGTGGSALVAKTLGEGKRETANRLFSLFVFLTIVLGVVVGLPSLFFLRPIAAALGAKGEMLEHCVTYGRIILLALPVLMLQYEFQSFFVTAQKPQLGLYVTLAAGCANMVLDALLVAIFPLGVVGAAAATAISQSIGGLIPLIYFARCNTGLLHLTRPRLNGHAILKACTNGSSEFLSGVSMSLVSMLYNLQLMKYNGENGVAAYGTLMYVMMIFIAVFLGYSIGSAPIISFHFGAGHQNELHSIFKKSLVLIGISSIVMFLAGELLARPLSHLFVGYNPELFSITLRGFFLFSFSFLFAGLPIFGSAFFTALNDGFTSALISFLRTVIFQTAAVLLLPLIWQLDGIWASMIVAELVAALVTVILWRLRRQKYGY